MNELSVIRYAGTEAADSRQVAQAVGTTHSELLKRIRTYCEYLTEGKIPLSDFFLESTYEDSTGRTLPRYMVTRKGCEMIANKMTGKKGVTFTALYVNAFHEMEQRSLTTELLARQVLTLGQEVEQLRHSLETLRMSERCVDYLEQENILDSIHLRAAELLPAGTDLHSTLGIMLISDIYADFKRHFNVCSYVDLMTDQVDEALNYICAWKPDQAARREGEED